MVPAAPPPTTDTHRLATLDRRHVWHPFTAMHQWQQTPPLVIDAAEGFELIDTDGRRYIDGVSSLWCNVHGHRVPAIDDAVRGQLGKVAHTTLLGLASTPSIALAERLVQLCDRHLHQPSAINHQPLRRVFYSDAGATALEVAFKMAVGYWHHVGRPDKRRFIGLEGAYHGDTTGSMSVGYTPLFHQPFVSMVFDVDAFPHCDPLRQRAAAGLPAPPPDAWPSDHEPTMAALADRALDALSAHLDAHADATAAIVIEPVMQGAAGMIAQPPSFLRRVADLAHAHDVLLIADEVATGFGRTGTMFACEHEGVTPDILCLAKGISGGYLPLAATLTTDAIHDAFTHADPAEAHRRTLYHGHTYTGNPLACAAALASLDLFHTPTPSPEQRSDQGPDDLPLLTHARHNAAHLRARLATLHDHPHVADVRQRGLMVGIELAQGTGTDYRPFDPARRVVAGLCDAMRAAGVIVRPLGDVLILMPAPAMPTATLDRLLDVVLDTLTRFGTP